MLILLGNLNKVEKAYKMKKKVKINNRFAQDSNFNDLLMTKSVATKYCKQYKKQLEKSFTNGFKFKHFTMIEKENYFTCSMS